ncbi:MAG: winged helix-turn-helix domain-containing protein [Candidatus Wenzhouxiangella sp. M2_3B_020]
MSGATQAGYRFDGWIFHPATGELFRDDQRTVLRPQVAAALALLLERAGTLVTREELRDELWSDEHVVSFDIAISTVMRQLRKALGDNPRDPHFIETIPRRGYRFLAAVSRVTIDGTARAADPVNAATRSRTAGAAALVVLVMVLLLLGGTASPPDTQSSETHVPMLAVLPFSNLTGNDAHDVPAHFLTDAVISYLSRIAPGQLRVAGLSSVLSYEDNDAEATTVGEALGAAYVLEGSLIRSADEVVASARLLETGDGTVIWSREYRRAAPDPAIAARSIAALAADGLAGAALLSDVRSFGGDSLTAALEPYRKGLYIRDRTNDARVSEALDLFRQATTLDPSFAAAHEALAETLIGPAAPFRTTERVEESRSAARRALTLDPLSATAHRVLGEIALYYDRNWDAADEHLHRAVDLAPGDAAGHHALALWYSARGRHADALSTIELARVLDPRSVAVSMDVMFVKLYARDWTGTIAAAERLGEMLPRNHWHRRFVIVAELARNNPAIVVDEARTRRLAWLERAGRGPGSVPESADAAVRAYFRVLGEVLDAASKERPLDPIAVAQWYALAGNSDRAAELVAEGVGGRYFSYFAPFLGVSPLFDPLRDSPSFQGSLKRLAQNGLTPANRNARLVALQRPDSIP